MAKNLFSEAPTDNCPAMGMFPRSPLRSRVQQRVDHRFNRARYDAERLLAAFAALLTEELDADAVTEDLARSVHTALEPTHVFIWLSER